MEFDMENRVDQTPIQLSPQPESHRTSPQIPDHKFNLEHQDRHSDFGDFEQEFKGEETAVQKRHSNPELQNFYSESTPNFTLEPTSSPAVETFATSLFGSSSSPADKTRLDHHLDDNDNNTNPQSPPPSLISSFAPFQHRSSTDLGHCSEPIYFGLISQTPPPPTELSDLKDKFLVSGQVGKDNSSEISPVDFTQLPKDSENYPLERETEDRNSSPDLEVNPIDPEESFDRAIALENSFKPVEILAEPEGSDYILLEHKENTVDKVSPEVAEKSFDQEESISQSPICQDYNMFNTKQHHTSFEDQEQPGPTHHVPTVIDKDHSNETEQMGDHQLLDFGEDVKVPVGDEIFEVKLHSPTPTALPDAMGQRRTVDGCLSSEPASPQSSSALTDVFSSPQKDPSPDAASPVRTERQEATKQDIEDLTNMIEKVNLRSNYQDPTLRDHQMTDQNFNVKTNGDHSGYRGGNQDLEGAMGQIESRESVFGLENGHRIPHSPANDGANVVITPVVAVKSPSTTKKISQTAPAKSSNKTAHGPTTTPTHGKNGLDHHGQAQGQDQVKAKTAKTNGVGIKAAPATAKPKGTTKKSDYSHVQSKCGSLAFIKGAQMPAVKAKDSSKVDGPNHDPMTTTTNTHTAHAPNGLHMGNGTSVTKRPTPTASSNQAKSGAGIGNGNATGGAGHSPGHQAYKKPANLKTVHSKVGSLENASYKPARIEKKIETVKLDFKCKAKSKIGSLDNAAYVPQGGNVKVQTHKLNFKETAAPKVQTKFIKSPQTATSPLVETGDA